MKQFLLMSLIMLTTYVAQGQSVTGDWSGELSVQTAKIPLVFHITQTQTGYSATMDSPSQGAKGIKMSGVTVKDSVLTLELNAARITYTGTVKQGVITGIFTQSGQAMPLTLTKLANQAVNVQSSLVEPAPPCVETPAVLQTKTGALYGTLATPKTGQRFPIALIIAGSGPTDRNGNSPYLASDAYKKLAYALAEAGIATLRYDKRAIGESANAATNEADLRFNHYVDDATGWIEWLKKDPRFTQVTVIGHSEGSLLGMLAAAKAKADKFVSIAGPGMSADNILKTQLSIQPIAYQDVVFPLIDSLVAGMTVHNNDPNLASLFRPSVQPYLISWLKYTPKNEIGKLTIPVLIIQGTNDIQVTVEDAKLLSAGNPKAKLVLIENMNHIFRTVVGDRDANQATYSDPALPLSDGFVEAITHFVLEK